MTTSTETTDASGVASALWAVFLSGVIATVGAGVIGGGRALLGVLLGAVLATANLWVIARIGRAFISGSARLPWSLVALAKFSVLFGVVFVVVSRGMVDMLMLLVGYGALPIGIVLAQLRSVPALRQES